MKYKQEKNRKSFINPLTRESWMRSNASIATAAYGKKIVFLIVI